MYGNELNMLANFYCIVLYCIALYCIFSAIKNLRELSIHNLVSIRTSMQKSTSKSNDIYCSKIKIRKNIL